MGSVVLNQSSVFERNPPRTRNSQVNANFGFLNATLNANM